MREASELYTFKLAEELLQTHVSAETLSKCGYDFSVERPLTFAVRNPTGFMDPNSNTVVYPKNDWEILLHEYIHYYNIGVSRECLDEVAASLIVAIEHEKWVRDRSRAR